MKFFWMAHKTFQFMRAHRNDVEQIQDVACYYKNLEYGVIAFIFFTIFLFIQEHLRLQKNTSYL